MTVRFADALATYNKATSTTDLSVTGTATYLKTDYPVTGTLQLADMAQTAEQFEGKAVTQNVENVAGLFYAAGGAWPLSMNVRNQWVGTEMVGLVWPDIYCVTAGSGALPQTVMAGDSGTIATMNCYADSSKGVQIGRDVITYTASKGATAQSIDVTVSARVQDMSGAALRQTSTTYQVTTAKVVVIAFGVQETTNGIAVNILAK